MQENIKSLIFVKFILSYRYTFDFDRYSVEIWSFKLCCLLFENRRREKEKKTLNLHLIRREIITAHPLFTSALLISEMQENSFSYLPL